MRNRSYIATPCRRKSRWMFQKMHASAKNTDTSTRRYGLSLTRFSLRTFLIAFTLLAIAFAVWADRARKQHTAVAALRELGVLVYYDFEVTLGSHGKYQLKPGPDGRFGTAVSDLPAWLVNTLGIDYFHTAAVVYLSNRRPMDALPFLKRLPRLKEVHVLLLNDTCDYDLDKLQNELPGVTVTVDLGIVCSPSITNTALPQRSP